MTSRVPIDVVAFDYGNVLSQPQDPAIVARMAAAAGVSVADFAPRYWRERVAYDRGDISASVYWSDVLRESVPPPAPAAVGQLSDFDAQSWLALDDAMVAWARALRADGTPIAILSNMPVEVLAGLRAHRGPWLEEFNEAVFSCDARSVKPEAAIYERLLTLFGVPAERVLFIDDREHNVEGAVRVGLSALHYTSFDTMRAEVETRFECRPPAPFLSEAMATAHLISGLPCSGKTTYAELLRTKTGGVHFSLDYYLISAYGSYSIAQVGNEEHVRRVLACRHLIWSAASEHLRRATDVILDDGFFYREHRVLHAALAAEQGATATIHYLNTPTPVVRARLDERNARLPRYNFRIDPATLDGFMGLYEPPGQDEGATLVIVGNASAREPAGRG